MKTRTVGGLGARHIGRCVLIDGVVYRVSMVKHERRRTTLWCEWDDPDTDDTCIVGDRSWPHSTRCRELDFPVWHRPGLRERLAVLRDHDAGRPHKTIDCGLCAREAS